MKTEVVMIPSSPPPEFNFESAYSSPFITAPSSPSRAFSWEHHSGISHNAPHFDDNFEFDFCLQRLSVSHAEDLFSAGLIKPLKPLSRVEFGPAGSSRSPESPGKSLIEALSPKYKKNDFDPFAEAIKESTKQGKSKERDSEGEIKSPLRVFDILSEQDPDLAQPKKKNEKSSLLSFSFTRKYKKIKELLLFRSASEGRKDEIAQAKYYTSNRMNFEKDLKNLSFRSTESSGSGSGSSMRRKGMVSAHEVHYTVNRAVQEEMKKKTPLPYKHGLMLSMGCLGLEPPVHDLARSFGSNRT